MSVLGFIKKMHEYLYYVVYNINEADGWRSPSFMGLFAIVALINIEFSVILLLFVSLFDKNFFIEFNVSHVPIYIIGCIVTTILGYVFIITGKKYNSIISKYADKGSPEKKKLTIQLVAYMVSVVLLFVYLSKHTVK